MITYKNIFSFKKNEIKQFFDVAKIKNKIPGLTLLQAPTDLQHGKVLIITPKKTGTAIKRNKLKRQIKSIVYEEKLYTKPVISILITYSKATELSFEELKTFLTKIFL